MFKKSPVWSRAKIAGKAPGLSVGQVWVTVFSGSFETRELTCVPTDVWRLELAHE